MNSLIAVHGPLMEVNNGSFSWQNIPNTQSSDQPSDQPSDQSSDESPTAVTPTTLKLRDINLNINKVTVFGNL